MLFKSSTVLALLFACTTFAADADLVTNCKEATQGKACKRCPKAYNGAPKVCYRGICRTRSLTGGGRGPQRVSHDSLEVSAGEIKADSYSFLLL
jgi:hypothetical protein